MASPGPYRRALAGACLVVPLIAAATDASAQYRIEQFTTSNGLPQNTVSAIVQTRDGYLWLGTYDGLVRYDGVRFTIFDKGNTPAIRSNQFLTLFEDSGGTLWGGTTEGGLLRHRDGGFAAFTTREGLPENFVGRIEEDAGGLLVWFRGRPHRRNADGSVTPAPLDERDGFVDRAGARWQRHDDRLSRTDGHRTVDFPVALSQDEFSRLRFEDRVGGVWFATRGRGLYHVVGESLSHHGDRDGVPSSPELRPGGQDREGNVWFVTNDALVSHKDGRFTVLSTRELLGSPYARAFRIDREGSIWVGTNANGLFRLTRRFLETYPLPTGFKSVYPVVEGPDGAIWLGGGDGLARLADGTVTTYAVTAAGGGRAGGIALTEPSPARPHLGVRSLAVDRQGGLWAGLSSGLISIDRGRVTNHTHVSGAVPVDAIYHDRAGRTWLGTTGALVKVEGARVTRYASRTTLPGDAISVITEDREGRIWIGTRGGLARYEDGRFTVFTTKDGLAGERVRSIYEDADGIIWIGTFDSGISRYEGGRFTNFTTHNGLFNNGAFQILEDARGDFWISCNRGIYRVSREQLNTVARGQATGVYSVAYGSPDGMRSTEANGGRHPAGVKARDGRLWFPTQDGAVVIDPRLVPYNTEPPLIVVESIFVDRVPVAPSAAIRVEAGQRDVEITYTAPSSIKPEHIHFKYRLIGLSDHWVDAGTRRTVSYSHLPPGRYTFRLIAANSDGVVNEAGVTIPIEILPHFYQTRWFLLLSAVLLGVAGAAIYGGRIRRLKARQQHLATLVSQRTSELQSANVRLQQLATLDGLTNIANHRRFKEFLAQEWQRSQRAREPLSMLMIDVDFFKLYNDTYGHQAGDECLKRVAVVLTETIQRGTDLAARYGGEEFAVVLTNTAAPGAAVVAESIRARVEALGMPHEASAAAAWVTISVGVATRVGDPEIGPDGLIAAADIALYRAKRLGRNRCAFEADSALVKAANRAGT